MRHLGNHRRRNPLADWLCHCKKEKVNITKENIKSWLSGTMPATTKEGRDKVYQLCFALGMNAQQTGEFFLKAYLERPFNYKDLREAVYTFCFNNVLHYTDALNLLNEAESIPFYENTKAENITEQIGCAIFNIREKAPFLEYIKENRWGFTRQNKTATEKILNLTKSCYKLAEDEFKISNSHEDPRSVNSIDDLLGVIYGYSARERVNSKAVFAKSINKSSFPELIKRNFPQREQFKNIETGQATYDVIRKALIMLNFYHFFADEIINGCKYESELFDEFVDETDALLNACGFGQLYWPNPYDWMIGHCAATDRPLGTLRDLIFEYYLDDNSVYNE